MPSARHHRTLPQSAMGDGVWDSAKLWEPPTSTTTTLNNCAETRNVKLTDMQSQTGCNQRQCNRDLVGVEDYATKPKYDDVQKHTNIANDGNDINGQIATGHDDEGIVNELPDVIVHTKDMVHLQYILHRLRKVEVACCSRCYGACRRSHLSAVDRQNHPRLPRPEHLNYKV